MQATSHRYVVLGRVNLTTWVIVRDYDARASLNDGATKNITRMNIYGIERSKSHQLNLHDMVTCIQVHHPKVFLIIVNFILHF